MKAYFLPRAIAFLIDAILISLVASLCFRVFPQYTNYTKLNQQLEDSYRSYLNQDITINEYVAQVNDLSYDIAYQEVPYMIIYIALTIGYFVVFQAKMNGQTIGKRLMRVRVVSMEKEESVTTNQYLIRAMINQTLFLNLVDLGMVLFMNKQVYGYVNIILVITQFIIMITCLVMVLYRKDARGLHDLAANTKVVMDGAKELVECKS